MPTIKNLSYGPLSISTGPDRETVTLGPRETRDISTDAFESDAVQKHLRERRITVIEEAKPEAQPRPKPNKTQTPPAE